MSDSILETIKKMLGIPVVDTAFDTDIIADINSVFMSLNQLGVGPLHPFTIIDNAKTWNDFLSTDVATFAAVKTYMYLKVKLLFDPPNTSYTINAYENQITEMEYRLKLQAESRFNFSSININTGTPILGNPTLEVI